MRKLRGENEAGDGELVKLDGLENAMGAEWCCRPGTLRQFSSRRAAASSRLWPGDVTLI